MRIWVVKIGESIPYLPASTGSHFFRAGDLVRRLIARGHEVTWWTAEFEHPTKTRHRVPGNSIHIPGATNSRVNLLNSPGYRSNLSPARFYDHWLVGRSFRQQAERAPAPDVIVSSVPIPELARATVDYGEKHGTPIIMDVRDLWPDAIRERFKNRFGIGLGVLAYPYERDVSYALARATSVTAITGQVLRWAQVKGNRSEAQQKHDRVFHLSSRRVVIPPSRLAQVRQAWIERGLDVESGQIVFAWAGSMTNQAATRALISSLSMLPPSARRKAKIVICGRGDLESDVRAVAQKHENVIYAGFVSRDEVQFLYDNSHYGLLCYDNSTDFKASFPNKFGEYLMSGLSVVTTINGAMQEAYAGAGFLHTVEPTPQALVAALAELAGRIPAPDIRDAARLAFEKDFNADLVYEQFCDHIESYDPGASYRQGR